MPDETIASPSLDISATLERPQAFLSHEDLREAGANLIRNDRADWAQLRSFKLADTQRAARGTITRVYQACFKAAEQKELLTPAAEWLIDNFFLIDGAMRQARESLSPKFVGQLPTIKVEGGADVPRVLALAWLIVRHSHCNVSEERVTAAVDGAQSVIPLQIGELWALPSFLRLVLVQELQGVTEAIENTRAMRSKADDVADAVLKTDEETERLAIVERNRALMADNAFAAQMLYRLRGATIGMTAIIDWLERTLDDRGLDGLEVQIVEQNRLSAGNVRIGAIIQSLRGLDDIDWLEWFSSVSLVDRLLAERSDFAALDFNSQDRYRNAIEELARQSKLPEAGSSQPRHGQGRRGRPQCRILFRSRRA